MLKTIMVAGLLASSASLSLAQSASPQHSPSNAGMAQPADIQNKPKLYQPANPAPDPRRAPTSSSTGIGNESGGRPEKQPKK